jgi:predicted methyltransferase
MSAPRVFSCYQTRPLLGSRRGVDANGQVRRARLSPDLGITEVEVQIEMQGVIFADSACLDWGMIEEICASQNNCFFLAEGQIHKIIVYSEGTGRVYSLMPTPSAPTMLVSGIPMHRIKDTDPYKDTLEKMRALGPAAGRILDTATGLGYTAIQASHTAEHVITIELDPAALEIARLNPWSRGLFDNPKIEQRIGDSAELIQEFDDGSFTCILHDPPVFSLAGQLYSSEFYAQLYRVLRRRGRLFHYVGNPESKSGASLTRGVARRLQEAGFRNVKINRRAFGLTASK